MGEHGEYLEISEPTFRAYAERQGFDLVIERESQCPERPASWSKIPLIQRLMERYDLVVWVDADAVFVDFSRDIGDACVRGADFYMVQHHYRDQQVPNAGVLMVRSSAAAREFLELVWSQHQYIDHNWWENAAILDLLGYRLWPCGPERESPHRRLVRFLGNEWNSIEEDPSPNPVIRHYAGKTREARLAGMRGDRDAVAPLLGPS